MASSESESRKPKKQTESVRERAERAISEATNSKKTDRADKKAVKAEKKVEKVEVAKVKPAKTRKIKFLNRNKHESKKDKKPRRFHIIPRFITEAFKEIRLVTWPDARTTFKLTTAVIIFATVFTIMVSLVDYGFGKIFKKVFLHG